MSHRLGVFAVFLICGLSIFLVPNFLDGSSSILYLAVLAIFFLLMTALLRRYDNLKYFPVSFAFFAASLVFTLVRPWGGGSTMENRVFNILLTTVLVVVPIVLLTKVSGNSVASIYLERGNLRLGLVVGLGTFLFFLATSVQASMGIFGGQNITSEQLASYAPWIAAFVFANGFREELLFRGLFLRKFESFLGASPSNLLQATCFSLAHLQPPFTSFSVVYVVLTFLLGLGFGAVIQKTGSLLGAVLFHAGADVPLMLAVFSNLN